MGRDQKQPFPVCASSRQLLLTLRISQAGCLTIDMEPERLRCGDQSSMSALPSALHPSPPPPGAVHRVITCRPGSSLSRAHSWPPSWQRRPAVPAPQRHALTSLAPLSLGLTLLASLLPGGCPLEYRPVSKSPSVLTATWSGAPAILLVTFAAAVKLLGACSSCPRKYTLAH